MQFSNSFRALAVSTGLFFEPTVFASQNFYLVQNTTQHPLTGKDAESATVLKGQGVILDDSRPEDGVLFLIDYTHTAKNGIPVSTYIRQTDRAGNLLVMEESLYSQTGQLQRYTIEQNQISAKGVVEHLGPSARITWSENGQTRTESESVGENLVTSGSLLAYMNSRIKSLEGGNKLEVLMAVPERTGSYAFEILPKTKLSPGSTKDFGVVVRLSNFILSRIVAPIRMTFQESPEGYRPLSIVAPAAVRRKNGKSLEKFTARIEYPRQ